MTLICSLVDVKFDLGIDEDDETLDDFLIRLIQGVTDYVERKAARSFTVSSSTKLFDGNDKGYIIVDDFLSLTQVELLNPDQTVYQTLTPPSVIGVPYNETPKYRIDIQNAVSENPYRVIGRSPYIFPRGIGNIRVTALWGSWATVPSGLENMAIDLVKAKFAKRRMRGIRSASIGGESVSFSDTDLDLAMTDTLMQYKRQYIEVW